MQQISKIRALVRRLAWCCVRLLLSVVPFTLFGCQHPSTSDASSAAQDKYIRNIVSISDLGKALFSDERLSPDGLVSCSSCHDANRSFMDGQVVTVLADRPSGARNTPTLIGIASNDRFFWDGRITSLREAVRLPLTNPTELANPSVEVLAKRLSALSAYNAAFAETFNRKGGEITSQEIEKALSEYIVSLRAPATRFGQFVRSGYKSIDLSPDEQHGYALFKGASGCSTCHSIGVDSESELPRAVQNPPLHLSTIAAKNLGTDTARLAQTVLSFDSKQLAKSLSSEKQVSALGHFVVTKNPRDIARFVAPSLLNIAATAPYMHDGSVSTLEEAVDYELYNRTAEKSLDALTRRERDALVAFLRSLTYVNR
jgi:cytochrome c peroxidase